MPLTPPSLLLPPTLLDTQAHFQRERFKQSSRYPHQHQHHCHDQTTASMATISGAGNLRYRFWAASNTPPKPTVVALTYIEVLLDPGVGSLPVLQAEVAVRVPTREFLLSHVSCGKVGLWREVLGDALQRLETPRERVEVRAGANIGFLSTNKKTHIGCFCYFLFINF